MPFFKFVKGEGLKREKRGEREASSAYFEIPPRLGWSEKDHRQTKLIEQKIRQQARYWRQLDDCQRPVKPSYCLGNGNAALWKHGPAEEQH